MKVKFNHKIKNKTLTPGKEYQVRSQGIGVYILDDNNYTCNIMFKNCHQLDGGNWEVVDEGAME